MTGMSAKESIIDAFIAKVEADSLRSLHVAKLIKEIGINRNTFYYHFPSKYDVAFHVYRRDLADELSSSFPAHELVYAPVGASCADELPFYTHREIGARTLDFGGFYKALVRCVTSRPAFYGKLFTYKEPEFRSLVDGLYRPAVRSDLEFMLGGRYLPRSTFELFLCRYTDDVFATAEYYLKHSRDAHAMLDDAVNPFWNMPYEALMHELQIHPVVRPRRA